MRYARSALSTGAVLGCAAACGRVVDTRCDPTATFGTPIPLTSLNTTANAEAAHLSPDELTIYFSSTRPGGMGGSDIYEAMRTSTHGDFGNVKAVIGVNTTADERSPSVTADGLSMFAMSGPSDGSAYRITLATRNNTSAQFSALLPVAAVNSTAKYGAPYILPKGDVLYLASKPSTGSYYALYKSMKTNGVFSSPALVDGIDLNSPSDKAGPVVTPDELTLFFSGDRSGTPGDEDIYEATRPTIEVEFGAPVSLTALNTPANIERPNWISPDGCNLYFTRSDPNLGFQLYVATRGGP